MIAQGKLPEVVLVEMDIDAGDGPGLADATARRDDGLDAAASRKWRRVVGEDAARDDAADAVTGEAPGEGIADDPVILVVRQGLEFLGAAGGGSEEHGQAEAMAEHGRSLGCWWR